PIQLSSRPVAHSLLPYTTLFRSPRRLDARDVDAGHLRHRLECALRLIPSDGKCLGQHSGSNLPRDAPFVLAPATGAFLAAVADRSEEHTSELQSRENLVCRLLLD